MGAGALTMLGVGGVIGGTAIQAQAARQQGQTEAAILEYNAAVAKQEAETTRTASAEEQALMREKMRKTLARNEVSVAASGFSMAGSPLDVQLGVIDDYAHDIGTLAYNREIEARKHESQARIFKYQAGAAKEAGRLGVGAALFGGVSSLTQIGLMNRLLRK